MLVSRSEKVKIMAILSISSIIILLIFQGGFYPYAYLLVALLGGVGIIVSKRSIAITRELGFLFIISLEPFFQVYITDFHMEHWDKRCFLLLAL